MNIDSLVFIHTDRCDEVGNCIDASFRFAPSSVSEV